MEQHLGLSDIKIIQVLQKYCRNIAETEKYITEASKFGCEIDETNGTFLMIPDVYKY
jgi:hypothetical protein